MNKDHFEEQEFKMLRDGLADYEKSIGTLLAIGLVSSVSLISGLIAIIMRDQDHQANEPQFPFFLLAPMFILIPIAWLLLSHRREIHKTGSYLQAFYDERSVGTRWELRVQAFRDHFEKGHTFDAIPALVWAVFGLSAVAFLYACFKFHTPFYAALVLVVPLALLARFHVEWKKCPGIGREEYLRIWRIIRKEEE